MARRQVRRRPLHTEHAGLAAGHQPERELALPRLHRHRLGGARRAVRLAHLQRVRLADDEPARQLALGGGRVGAVDAARHRRGLLRRHDPLLRVAYADAEGWEPHVLPPVGQLRLRRREHEADGAARARQREDDLGGAALDEAHRAARQLGLKRRVRLILRQRRLDFEQPARRRLLRRGVRKVLVVRAARVLLLRPAGARPPGRARDARRRRAGGGGARAHRLRRIRLAAEAIAPEGEDDAAELGLEGGRLVGDAVAEVLEVDRDPLRRQRRLVRQPLARPRVAEAHEHVAEPRFGEQLERGALDADVELRPREHRDGQRDRRVVGRRRHVDEVEHHRVLVVLRPRRRVGARGEVDPVRASEQLDGEPLGAQPLLGDDERRAVVVVHGDGEPRHRAVRHAGERGAALLGRHLVLRRARLEAEVKDRQVAPQTLLPVVVAAPLRPPLLGELRPQRDRLEPAVHPQPRVDLEGAEALRRALLARQLREVARRPLVGNLVHQRLLAEVEPDVLLHLREREAGGGRASETWPRNCAPRFARRRLITSSASSR